MFKDFHTNFISSCISYIKQISKEKELENKSTRDCKRDDLKDHIPGYDEGKGQSIKLEVGQHDAHGQVVESLIDLVMINSQEVGVETQRSTTRRLYNQDAGVDTPGQVFSQEVGVETQGSTPGDSTTKMLGWTIQVRSSGDLTVNYLGYI